MTRKWARGDKIEYREIILTQAGMDQEARFGWERLGPIVFPPGTRPPFAAFAARNVHTSVDFARQQGLKGTIAPGIMFVGHISDMLVGELGAAWAERGEISLRFVHTAGPGDILRTSATVRGVTLGERGTRVAFDVLMVNQHAEPIVEGEAEAILS
jgi:hypothetical protein